MERNLVGRQLREHRESVVIRDLVKASIAALHALRSYQYGNSAPDLAEEVADELEAAFKNAREVFDK